MAEAVLRREPGLARILSPKWRAALARFRRGRAGALGKTLVLLGVGGVFWSALFAIAYRVLVAARAVPDLGLYLPGKVLGAILLTFGSILLLSNVITSLSTFFLAKDLDLLAAAPVDWLRVYLAKLAETIVHSSWMVVLLALPILTAYGIVYAGGPLFPLVAAAALAPVLVICGALGSALTLVLVNVFPARRTRDLLSLIAIGAAASVVVLLRLLRPEQLVRPEGFQNLLDFLVTLRTPANPYLPTEWAARVVMNWLTFVADPLPPTVLWLTAAATVVIGAALHGALYRDGYSKAQEGAERFVRGKRWSLAAHRFVGFLPVQTREFVLKDLRIFFRDTTQWSQLILLAVLLIVYLFNIQALPLYTGERVSFLLVTLVTFLNLGLAGFVLAAIAARFVFPAISLEGRQLWLLRSSPLPPRTLLWSKYWTGAVPLLVVALVITVLTNLLLRASPFMMALSVGTIILYTLATCALALAFGAYYPQFDTENAAQIPTSFGGLVFMMSSVTFLAVVIVVEARPVLNYVRAMREQGQPRIDADMVLAMAVVAALCLATTLGALAAGARRLEEIDR